MEAIITGYDCFKFTITRINSLRKANPNDKLEIHNVTFPGPLILIISTIRAFPFLDYEKKLNYEITALFINYQDIWNANTNGNFKIIIKVFSGLLILIINAISMHFLFKKNSVL